MSSVLINFLIVEHIEALASAPRTTGATRPSDLGRNSVIAPIQGGARALPGGKNNLDVPPGPPRTTPRGP